MSARAMAEKAGSSSPRLPASNLSTFTRVGPQLFGSSPQRGARLARAAIWDAGHDLTLLSMVWRHLARGLSLAGAPRNHFPKAMKQH